MANTTFTGNVRENGDGNRDSIAGSMAATANFHIANTLTAGDGSVQKSETDTTVNEGKTEVHINRRYSLSFTL